MNDDKDFQLKTKDYGIDVFIRPENYPDDMQNVGMIFRGLDGYHRFMPITRMPLTCKMLRDIASSLSVLNTDNKESQHDDDI